jgi:hypothetical protein
MTDKINITIDRIIPSREAVLQDQGIPNPNETPYKIIEIAVNAIKILSGTIEPKTIFDHCSLSEFKQIYFGNGNNDSPAPLENIMNKSPNMYLFAVTLGPAISQQIENLFSKNDFALGSMVDSAASLAADLLATTIEEELNMIKTKEHEDEIILGYSPGYCGWHISGQRELFQYLKPESIGITLNNSYLMNPLKSISGVMISAKAETHIFSPKFEFCKLCQTRSCINRMRSLSRNNLKKSHNGTK